MHRTRSSDRLVFATLLVLVLATTPAHAYIDPGSGSLFLQGMIAGVLALAFAIKNYWRNIRAWVAAKFSGSGERNAG